MSSSSFSSAHIELYRYWAARCGTRTMPARADLDPVAMKPYLPHLMLFDVVGERFRYRLVGTRVVQDFGRDVTGKDAEAALGAAHITVNKNAVPGDPRSPFVTSGLRIGTPAVTTRGYKEPDCVALAEWMCDVLDAPGDERVLAGVRENVVKQCRQFPVYEA